jgi:polyferredoxin
MSGSKATIPDGRAPEPQDATDRSAVSMGTATRRTAGRRGSKGPWTWVRRGTQASVVLLIGWLGYRHAQLGGGPGGTAPLDAFCPFGAIETLPSLLTNGTFLKKTAVSGFIVLGAVAAMTAVGRASFCGWLCPLGTVVEWVHRAGRAVARAVAHVPGVGRIGRAADRWGRRRARRGAWLRSARGRRIDSALRYLRYGVLALILFLTFQGQRLVFEGYDPFKAVFHFQIETVTTIVVLALLFLSSLLVERFWCRYLCPLGAVVSLGSHLSPAGITRDAAACIDCGKCDSACGMGLEVASVERVTSGQCSLCGECTSVCPADGALRTSWAGPRFSSLRPIVRPALAVSLFAVVIAGSMAAGVWETRASAGGGNGEGAGMGAGAGVAGTLEGGAGSGAATEGDHEAPTLPLDGTATAEQIKGRMTAEEVATAFGVSPAEVLSALGAPVDADTSISVKALAGTYGGSVSDLREWLASR